MNKQSHAKAIEDCVFIGQPPQVQPVKELVNIKRPFRFIVWLVRPNKKTKPTKNQKEKKKKKNPKTKKSIDCKGVVRMWDN